MRILIVTQTFPLTPSDPTAHFMYDFAKGFTKLGHQVFVVLPFHPRLDIRSFPDITLIPFRYIWPDSFHLLGFGRTLKDNSQLPWYVYLLIPFYILFCSIALFKIIRKYNIDIINAHWILPNGFIAALISRLTNKPLFITIPGSDAYIARQNMLFGLTVKFAILSSCKVISNGPQLLADLQVKGETIPYGVAKNMGKRPKTTKIKIASAGRFVEKKGFALLKIAYPEAEIISTVAHDIFLRKLLEVDIFVVPSIRDVRGNVDGSPIVLCEAMAAGCAVVATDLPGNHLIIKHNQNGLLVKPNVKEIKKAIERLKVDKNLRQRLGKAARETIRRHFTPEAVAKSYIAHFKRLDSSD